MVFSYKKSGDALWQFYGFHFLPYFLLLIPPFLSPFLPLSFYFNLFFLCKEYLVIWYMHTRDERGSIFFLIFFSLFPPFSPLSSSLFLFLPYFHVRNTFLLCIFIRDHKRDLFFTGKREKGRRKKRKRKRKRKEKGREEKRRKEKKRKKNKRKEKKRKW